MGTNSSDPFLDYLCRTCMHELVEVFSYDSNSKPEQQWHSILDEIEECGSLSIAELLTNAVPQLELHLSDEMPKKICRKCLEQVRSIFRFQNTCLETDQRMRKLIADGNNDIKGTTSDGTLEHEIKANELTAQECFVEPASEERIYNEEVNTLQAAATPSSTAGAAAADPLQSTDAQTDDSMEYTNEPCNDNGSNDGGTPFNVNLDVVKKETDENMQNLASSENACALCKKSFKGPRALKAHLRCHKKSADSKLPKYTCELCKKSYNARRSLTRHTQIRHSIEKSKKPPKKEPAEKPKRVPKKHICEICDKIFTRSTTLREHLTIHTNSERSFLCTECGKAFAKECHLKNHVLRHSEVAAFECPLCPKKFRTRNDVSKHKVIHQEIKKHVCDICGDRFVKRHQLTVHKRYHSGIKPYKCDYCDMRFVSKYNNRLHMRTHTGEKPYKCKYCERAFAQSNDHMKHLRTHIGDNVYRCELCPLAFRLASELRVHFATHKNEDEETRERNMKALKEAEAKLQFKLAEAKAPI